MLCGFATCDGLRLERLSGGRKCSGFALCVLLRRSLSRRCGQDKQFTDDWSKGANPPGSTLVLKETGRNAANGQTIVSYRLFASGLPKAQHFTLWTWNLGSQPQAVADAFISV